MRDFFYSKSDLLVALIIILLAAFVIYTRVGVIMEYPTRAQGENSAIYESETTSPDEEAGTDADNQATVANEDNDVSSSSNNSNTDSTDSNDSNTNNTNQSNQNTGRTVSFIVSSGDASGAIADNLVTLKLIANKQAFLNEVATQSAETKFKPGTFNIPMGSTHAQIIEILTTEQ